MLFEICGRLCVDLRISHCLKNNVGLESQRKNMKGGGESLCKNKVSGWTEMGFDISLRRDIVKLNVFRRSENHHPPVHNRWEHMCGQIAPNPQNTGIPLFENRKLTKFPFHAFDRFEIHIQAFEDCLRGSSSFPGV